MPTLAFDEEPALVQRASDLVREVFSAEIALNLPVVKIGIAQ